MKRISILMVMIAAILFTTSCKKDDDSSEGPNVSPIEGNGYRVVEENITGSGGMSGVNKFKYEGNKLTKVESLYKNPNEDNEYKEEVSYSGDEITIKNFIKEGENWKDADYTRKLTVKDGLITTLQVSYTSYNTITTKYTYDGKKLIKTEENKVVGSDKTTKIVEYTYSGDKVVEVLTTVTGAKTSKKKEKITYEGDKIVKTVGYDYDEKTQKFKYNGDMKSYVYNSINYQLQRIVTYTRLYDFDTKRYEIRQNSYTNYEYDHVNLKLISKEKFIYDYKGTKIDRIKTTYKYEKGDGNIYVLDKPEMYLVYKDPIAQ